MPPFDIRIATDFDDAATHPNGFTALHKSKNAVDGFRFLAYPGLSLVVGQTVQAARV